MFVLVELEDTVSIVPSAFDEDLFEHLRRSIANRYANRVLKDCGLCIGLYRLDGHRPTARYFPGDASAYIACEFRVVVFRPHPGEVLSGRIQNCDATGIRVSLGFFDDVFIPADRLHEPSVFDETTRLWQWRYNAGSGGDDALLDMDVSWPVRFRVDSIRFNEGAGPDTAPAAAAPGVVGGGGGANSARAGGGAMAAAVADAARAALPDVTLRDAPAPMKVIASVAESGLGMLSWWAPQPAADDGDDDGGGGD